MQRLVYSPRAFVFIKASNGQVYDLSRYVVSGSVNRRLNAASTAQVVLRNPKMLFTAKEGRHAAFKPMDPITIWLQRLRHRPTRVFTGFLDRTPYLQLYPGTITLTASCTLKKLLYTYFDPALPYTRDFLAKYGWAPDQSGSGIYNPSAITGKAGSDGGMGQLLYATLKEIGGWHERNIKIERLPSDLITRMASLFATFRADLDDAQAELEHLIHTFVGSGDYGNSGGDNSASIALRGSQNAERAFNYFRDRGFTAIQAAGICGVMQFESHFDPNITNAQTGDAYGIAQWTSTGNRKQRLLAWPKHDTLGGQLDFIWHELRGDHSYVMPHIKAANTINEAVLAWLMYFEGIQGSNLTSQGFLPQRESFARGFLKLYGDNPLEPKNLPGGLPGEQNSGTERAKRRDGRQDKSSGGSDEKIYAPIAGNVVYGRGWHESSKGVTGLTNTSGSVHWHSGVDAAVPQGTPCVAPCDGVITMASAVWSDGGMVHFKFTKNVGQIKAGTIIGWGHVQDIRVHVGERVHGGQVVASSGNPGGGPHVHFILRTDGSDGTGDGSADPTPILQALQKGDTVPVDSVNSNSSSGGGGSTGSEISQVMNRVNATFLAGSLNWSTMEDTLEAVALTGNKSLMNDKPMMPFIQQMTDASLRQFQSMPNGDFFAFYPDYFGETFHRPPYWYINDIEILEGGVDLDDSALVTHEYVIGDTTYSGDSFTNKLMSAGVVSIINAFVSDLLQTKDNKDDKKKDKSPKELFHAFDRILKQDEAIEFLQRYGARPNVEEYPMVRHPFFELFLAYQHFMQAWSRQFLTPFQFTFMPELYPGGKVGLPDHGLQMFIEEVTHNWDYAGGFVTEGQLSSPAVMLTKDGKAATKNLPPNMPTAMLERF
jgi:murein DD-endopeptidase MepM/ murein hydrolase activator NlpD